MSATAILVVILIFINLRLRCGKIYCLLNYGFIIKICELQIVRVCGQIKYLLNVKLLALI